MIVTMVDIRPPFERPVPDQRSQDLVSGRPRLRIRHPAYSGVGGGLLSLVASDGEKNETCGIQFALVHSACIVITGRDDVWLETAWK